MYKRNRSRRRASFHIGPIWKVEPEKQRGDPFRKVGWCWCTVRGRQGKPGMEAGLWHQTMDLSPRLLSG